MPERFLDFIRDYRSLFGGIGGAVTTLVFLQIGKLLSRPRLALSFDANSDAYLSTSKHFEDDKQVTRNYLRVSVRAKGLFKTFFGSSGAEKCLIYISAIRPVESGRAGQDRLFDARAHFMAAQ